MSNFASQMTSDGDSSAKGCSPWRDTQLRNFHPQEGRAVKGTSPLCGARQSDRNRKSCDAATKQVTVRHGHTVVHAHIDSLETVVLSLHKAQLAFNPYIPYNQRSAAVPYHGPGAPASDIAAHDLAEVALQVQRLIADNLGTHCGSLRDAAFKLRKTRGVTSCLAKKLAQLNAATSLLRHSSSQWTANLMRDVEAALDSTAGKAVTSPDAGDENTNNSTCADTQSDAAEVASVLTSGHAIAGNNSTCADTLSDVAEVASVLTSGQATSGDNNNTCADTQSDAAEVTSTSGQATSGVNNFACADTQSDAAEVNNTCADSQSDAAEVTSVSTSGQAFSGVNFSASDAAEVTSVSTPGQTASGTKTKRHHGKCAKDAKHCITSGSKSNSDPAASGLSDRSDQPIVAQRRLAKRANEAKHNSTFPDTQSDADFTSGSTSDPAAAACLSDLSDQPVVAQRSLAKRANEAKYNKPKSSSHSFQGPGSDQEVEKLGAEAIEAQVWEHIRRGGFSGGPKATPSANDIEFIQFIDQHRQHASDSEPRKFSGNSKMQQKQRREAVLKQIGFIRSGSAVAVALGLSGSPEAAADVV
jgi:hypothetical protein